MHKAHFKVASEWFDLTNMHIFKFTLGHCFIQTDDFHLTLPPEILPVHLPAQPAWTPGPGSFHYGTAAGHSRPAKEKKRTRVRQWSDVNTAKMSNTKATLIRNSRIICMSAHKQGKVSEKWFRSGAIWQPGASYLSPLPVLYQHTRWFCRGTVGFVLAGLPSADCGEGDEECI